MSDTNPASTEASEPRWRSFLSVLAVVLVGILGVVAAFIFVMDPHDHIIGSPEFKRAPINANQRYSYPALARKPHFDSAIIGTSTSRMLQPKLLGATFGGSFVNLAMNSATAYEQSRILDLFLRSRTKVRTLVFGVDSVWCDRQPSPAPYTPRPFPEWMYDDDPWNDLPHIVNGPTLEQAVRQLQYQQGSREPRYGFDGYTSFVPPASQYDLAKVRKKLYGPSGQPAKRNQTPGTLSDKERRSAGYGGMHRFARSLQAAPADTRVLFWFVPYHNHRIPPPQTKGGQWLSDCKQRVVELARQIPRALVVDMMFESPTTLADTNYWDELHITLALAETLPTLLLRVAEGAEEVSARRLYP